MSIDKESLKRVLLGIKGAAKGFKKERMKDRRGGQAPVAVPEDAVAVDPATMEPGDSDPFPMDAKGMTDPAPELAEGESGKPDGDDDSSDSAGPTDVEKERAKIMALIRRS